MAVFGPVWVPDPTTPDAFVTGEWVAVDQHGGDAVVVDILALPADNGSVITDVEYRLDGGAWTSLGLTDANTANVVTGLTDGVSVDIELRAINANGAGDPSDLKARTPTTVSYPAVSTGAMNQGISGLADFGAAQPFADIMKQLRIWPDNAPKDANGWPDDVSGGTETLVLLTDLESADIDTSFDGHYYGTYAGTGTFTVVGTGVSNLVINATTFEFDYTAPGAGGGINVQISDTDTGGDHLRAFTCVHADDYVAWQSDATVLRSAWETELTTRKLFRFMDWMQTNNSTVSTWADRPVIADATWTLGVPVEIMVSVCNRLGVGGWFCFPHETTDDYVHQFVRYVRDNLNPALEIVTEFSNELWNPLFTQYAWCATQADTVEGWGTGGTQGYQYAGKRAAQVMDATTGLLGGQTSRLERVCGVQTDWQAISENILEAALSVAQGNPEPYKSMDAIAVTGYFSGGLVDTTADWNTAEGLYTGTSPEAGYRFMYDLCAPEIATALPSQWAGYETLMGTYIGGPTRLVMYEGGSHVTPFWLDPAPTNPATCDEMNLAFHESPYLYQLLVDAMVAWDSVPGRGPWNYFGDFGEGPWAMAPYPGATHERQDIANAYNSGTAFGVYNLGLRTAFSVYSPQHSLWNHTLGLDINNQNVPNWLHRLATHTGMTTAQNGDFGQMPQFADYPDPRNINLIDDISYSEAPSGWDTDLATSGFDGFVIMADNFIMETFGGVIGYASTENYPAGSGWTDTTWTAESQLLYAHADAAGIPATFMYTHIHGLPAVPASVTAPQFDTWLSEVRGMFADWHDVWHDDVLTAQPTFETRMVPYGKIWGELAQDYLTGMDVEDWCEDQAPHGTPNMYFIAAAVAYSSFYGEMLPASYVPPAPLHADIIANWATIRQVIWDRLIAYVDGSGDNRVFPPGTV